MSLKGKLESAKLSFLNLSGISRTAAQSGAASAIKVLMKDGSGNVLLATGAAVPADTTAGYAKGCLFIDTDVAGGTTGLNCNKGTTTSCAFTAVTQA
jgi:hypothetical protein